MDCPQCYSTLEAGSNHCPFCGWVGESGPAVDPSPEQSPVSDADTSRWVEQWRAQFERREILVPDRLFTQAREMMQRANRQMRLATVLFADLKGFSAESKLHHPAAIDAVLGDFARIATQTTLLHHGFLLSFAGDGVLLVFGAPVAFERDTENAVAAALELRRRVQDLTWPGGSPVVIRMGIATGQLLATTMPSSAEAGYTVIGSTVNLAARLEQNAKPGQILLCKSTRPRVQHRYELESTGPLVLKNVSEGYEAWSVVGSRLEPHDADPHVVPFIGRRTELNQISRAILTNIHKAGLTHIHVLGEPGIGKSRLVRELERVVDGKIHCEFLEVSPVGQHVLFQPLIAWLRRKLKVPSQADAEMIEKAIEDLISRTAELGPEDSALAGYLFGLPAALSVLRATAPERLRENLSQFFLRCLRSMTSDQPIALILDDAQWLDEATCQWLRWLAQQCPERMCVITTAHELQELERLELENPPDPLVRLAPLDKSECEALVAQLRSGQGVQGEFPANLIQRAGGNPLFLTEVTQWDTADVAVPDSILEIVQWRLDKLDTASRHLLHCGAVIGHSFARQLIEEIEQEISDLTDHLNLLKTQTLLEELAIEHAAWLRFLHPIVRDVAYELLLPEERREFHAKVAEKIQAHAGDTVSFEVCDILAYHWEKAEDRGKAVYWLIKSSERSQQVGAYQQTLLRCGRALELLRDAEALPNPKAADFQRVRLMLRMGRVQVTLGCHDEAQRHLDEAMQLAEALSNPPARAEAVAWQGVLALNMGRVEAARAQLDQALTLSRQLKLSHLEAACLSALGVLAFQQADARRAIDCFRQLGELGDREKCPAWSGDACNNWALMEWKCGHYELASNLYAQALPHRRAVGDLAGLAVTLMNIGILHEKMGREQSARAHYQQSRELAGRMGHRRCLAAIAVNESNLLMTLGDFRGALEKANDAISQSASLGDVRLEAIGCNNFAQAALALDMGTDAEFHARRARCLLRRGADREARISAFLTLVEWRMSRLDFRHSRQHQHCLRLTESILCQIQAQRDGLGELEPRALMVKALLADPPDAFEFARQALEAARQINNQPAVRRIQNRLGHLLDGRGETFH